MSRVYVKLKSPLVIDVPLFASYFPEFIYHAYTEEGVAEHCLSFIFSALSHEMFYVFLFHHPTDAGFLGFASDYSSEDLSVLLRRAPKPMAVAIADALLGTALELPSSLGINSSKEPAPQGLYLPRYSPILFQPTSWSPICENDAIVQEEELCYFR